MVQVQRRLVSPRDATKKKRHTCCHCCSGLALFLSFFGHRPRRKTLNAHERLPMARRAEHPTPARPRAMPFQGKRALPPTTTFSIKKKNCNQVPNAEGDISSMEPRREDATSTVCCVDGGDEPRSRRAWLQNNALLILVTSSKPTGSSAPSKSPLLCLEFRELPIQCVAVADVAQCFMTPRPSLLVCSSRLVRRWALIRNCGAT